MQLIQPLLTLDPGEVLINFITSHVKRFIESPQDETRESFVRLFGTAEFKSHIGGLERQDREDALVAEYCESVKRTGRYKYVLPAIVLHPEKDRTHFNLIYATRHESGVKAFKDAEKKAMKDMERTGAEAQRRSRESKTGQQELQFEEEAWPSIYYESLRHRYLTKSRKFLRQQLSLKRRMPYDDAWALALTHPLTWESDLKDWISDWVKDGELRIEGMRARQRVPQRGNYNFLVWLKKRQLLTTDSSQALKPLQPPAKLRPKS